MNWSDKTHLSSRYNARGASPLSFIEITPLSLPVILTSFGVAVVAAYFDIRWRRIPNWLTLAALVLGLSLNILLPQGLGAGQSGIGIAVGLLMYFPLYLLKGMGAGDVKLAAAIGSLAGGWNCLLIILVAACVSAAAGLMIAASKGRFRSTLINVGFIFSELAAFRLPHLTRKEIDIRHASSIRLPHGVSLAVGTVAIGLATVLSQ